MQKVIVFGTFDIFHKGHQNFFQQAKKFGDFLVVVVARDENVLQMKGTLPKNNEKKRWGAIKRYDLVDEAILGNKNKKIQQINIVSNKDEINKNDLKDNYKYKILLEEKPDIICLGYDQSVNLKTLQKKLKEYKMDKVKVVRLKPYQEYIYKSSLLKK